MRQEFSNPTKSARTLSAPGHLLDDLSGGHGCHIGNEKLHLPKPLKTSRRDNPAMSASSI